jgi:hypothetical protein
MREREKEWIGHRKHIKYASVLLCINLVIRKTCEHKFCCFYIFSYFPSFFYRFTFLKNIAIVKRVSLSLFLSYTSIVFKFYHHFFLYCNTFHIFHKHGAFRMLCNAMTLQMHPSHCLIRIYNIT